MSNPDPDPESDKKRIDWMEEMRRECEGHILTRCFMREQIDELMRLNED